MLPWCYLIMRDTRVVNISNTCVLSVRWTIVLTLSVRSAAGFCVARFIIYKDELYYCGCTRKGYMYHVYRFICGFSKGLTSEISRHLTFCMSDLLCIPIQVVSIHRCVYVPLLAFKLPFKVQVILWYDMTLWWKRLFCSLYNSTAITDIDGISLSMKRLL